MNIKIPKATIEKLASLIEELNHTKELMEDLDTFDMEEADTSVHEILDQLSSQSDIPAVLQRDILKWTQEEGIG